MSTRFLPVPAATLLALSVGWGLVACGGSEATPSPTVSEHPVTVPAITRTVNVSMTMPMPSAHEKNLSAMLERGSMPTAPTTAEVLTDTDCVPDDEMVSRCRNEMRLPDGTKLVLRHPHDMTKVPCLAPGEYVRLMPVDA